MRGNKSKALRIGIVGAGAIVRDRHLPGLSRCENVEIAAVCNSTYESSKRFCESHLPHATPMKNWADLLMLPDLDIVWIGTPPHMHAPVTVSALEAGRHVFCQARMAMNVREAREMYDMSTQNPHLVTMLCPPPHGMKAGATFRRLLVQGVAGEILHARLRSTNGAFADPEASAHWRQRKELSGLNVMTLGIYTEVLQSWLGPVASVNAMGRIVHPMRQGYRVKIPDILNVQCEFDSGLLASMEFSSVDPNARGDTLEIYGSKGSLVYDFTDESITFAASGEQPEAVAGDEQESGEWTVEADFIRAVENPQAPRPHPTFVDGLSYMKVVQAVADSIDEGRKINVAEY